jgi:hypothetical protein
LLYRVDEREEMAAEQGGVLQSLDANRRAAYLANAPRGLFTAVELRAA